MNKHKKITNEQTNKYGSPNLIVPNKYKYLLLNSEIDFGGLLLLTVE